MFGALGETGLQNCSNSETFHMAIQAKRPDLTVGAKV
jgi:hypothetical protein